MHILLETESTNPEFNGECDCAVVAVTRALVRQIRQRVRQARRLGRDDADLCELYFWCGTAQFFDSTLLDACQQAVAADTANAERAVRTGWPIWTQRPCTPADRSGPCVLMPQPVECSQLILRTHFYGTGPSLSEPGRPAQNTRTSTLRPAPSRWRP